MDNSRAEILDVAAALARQKWDKDQTPYALSDLTPALKDRRLDYRKIIAGQKLKEFLQANPHAVKVVLHPTQKAKIGLIPPDKAYEYAVADTVAAEPKAGPPLHERKGPARPRPSFIVSSFLGLLSELDEADIAQVQIPTHIIAKLMRDR